jgi:ankyrin repeat protein
MDWREFDSQYARTALMCAAAKGHTDFVRLLIDAGADKDVKDNVRVCLSPP